MSVDTACKAISAEVARLLREERINGSLSLNQLSAKARVSRQMVSYIEQGERNPSLDMLLRITFALGVDLDDVLRRARRVVPAQRIK